MAQKDLLVLLESTSLTDLQSLVAAKEKLDKLTQRKEALEKDLAVLDREIESIQRSLGTRPAARPAAPAAKAPARKRPGRGTGKRKQPSIQSLIIDILREQQGALTVNEIADRLLNQKKYKTSSANFKNQLRVLLYRNQKKLFRKVGTGSFALAEGPAPAGGGTDAAPAGKSAPRKKTVAGKPAAPKAAAGKPAARKGPKKAAPKRKTASRK